MIFRFITRTIQDAALVGADRVEDTGAADSFTLRYLRGDVAIETHAYPALMRQSFQDALFEWVALTNPDPIQIGSDGRTVAVTPVEINGLLTLRLT